MTDTYDKINWVYSWVGGKMPVHPKTEVELLFRGGSFSDSAPAVDWSWECDDFAAFRITKLYVEPRKAREFWVNVRADGRIDSVHKCREASISALGESIHVREVLSEQDDG